GSEKAARAGKGAGMVAASADTTVAMHQDTAKIHLTLTPSDSATCWLSAVARIAIPVDEKRKKTENPASSASTTTKLHRCTGDTGTGPRGNGCWENRTGNGRVSLPQVMFRRPRITLATPKVTMMTEMIGSPMSGRRTPRSMTSPSRIATISVSGSAIGNGNFMLRIVAQDT